LLTERSVGKSGRPEACLPAKAGPKVRKTERLKDRKTERPEDRKSGSPEVGKIMEDKKTGRRKERRPVSDDYLVLSMTSSLRYNIYFDDTSLQL
jgi:hypothetical protein